jgi:hypothetical protein
MLGYLTQHRKRNLGQGRFKTSLRQLSRVLPSESLSFGQAGEASDDALVEKNAALFGSRVR